MQSQEAVHLWDLHHKVGYFEELLLDRLSVQDLASLRLTSKQAKNVVDKYLSSQKRRLLKLDFFGPAVTEIELSGEFRDKPSLSMRNLAEDVVFVWSFKNGGSVFLQGLIIEKSQIVRRIRVDRAHMAKSGVSKDDCAYFASIPPVVLAKYTKEGLLALIVKLERSKYKCVFVLVYDKDGQFVNGKVIPRIRNFAASESFFLYVTRGNNGNSHKCFVMEWSDSQLEARQRQGVEQLGRSHVLAVAHSTADIFIFSLWEDVGGELASTELVYCAKTDAVLQTFERLRPGQFCLHPKAVVVHRPEEESLLVSWTRGGAQPESGLVSDGRIIFLSKEDNIRRQSFGNTH